MNPVNYWGPRYPYDIMSPGAEGLWPTTLDLYALVMPVGNVTLPSSIPYRPLESCYIQYIGIGCNSG